MPSRCVKSSSPWTVKTLLPTAIWGGLLFQIACINNFSVVGAYNNKTLELDENARFPKDDPRQQ